MNASDKLTARNVFGSLTLQNMLVGYSHGRRCGKGVLLVELGSKGLDNLQPVRVWRQASSGSTSNAVSAVELNMQGIEYVTSRADGDTNTICKRGGVMR